MSNSNKSRAQIPTGKVVWKSIVIRRERDLQGLMGSAMNGDYVGRGFMVGIARWLKHHRRVPARKAPLCLSCEHAFRRDVELPGVFMMTFSEDARVKHVILTGVCETCATKRSDPELLELGSKQICKVINGEMIGFDFHSGQPESTH